MALDGEGPARCVGNELVELRRDAPEVRAGDAYQVLDGPGTEPQSPDTDLAFDPRAEIAALDCGVKDDGAASRLHRSDHRVPIRHLGMRNQTENRCGCEFAENRHQAVWRIDATSLG